LRKRFYIMLVARNAEGELLKIPVPMHYLYVFVAGALIGMLTITGMLGSYTRMVVKTQRFNQLRDEQKALKSQYSQLEQIAQENELQAQSLSSLAGEVSSLYGLRIVAAVLRATEFSHDRRSFSRHWHGRCPRHQHARLDAAGCSAYTLAGPGKTNRIFWRAH
jgi:hypothetical protein